MSSSCSLTIGTVLSQRLLPSEQPLAVFSDTGATPVDSLPFKSDDDAGVVGTLRRLNPSGKLFAAGGGCSSLDAMMGVDEVADDVTVLVSGVTADVAAIECDVTAVECDVVNDTAVECDDVTAVVDVEAAALDVGGGGWFATTRPNLNWNPPMLKPPMRRTDANPTEPPGLSAAAAAGAPAAAARLLLTAPALLLLLAGGFG